MYNAQLLPKHVHVVLNPLNAKLNPICHLLALLGAHHILHISRIRVNEKLLLSVVRACKLLRDLTKHAQRKHYTIIMWW
jgi:hypothetical protein